MQWWLSLLGCVCVCAHVWRSVLCSMVCGSLQQLEAKGDNVYTPSAYWLGINLLTCDCFFFLFFFLSGVILYAEHVFAQVHLPVYGSGIHFLETYTYSINLLCVSAPVSIKIKNWVEDCWIYVMGGWRRSVWTRLYIYSFFSLL